MDIMKNKRKKKIMLMFGTRPEAIKMCPLVKELRQRPELEVCVCVSGQHQELLYSVLDAFEIVPDYDLAIMREGQSLLDVTGNILASIGRVLERERPDVVLVHGDTSSAFSSALACFYHGISVGHVEAGLRTYDVYSPYPEEFNRRAISLVAKYHFAPTECARENLLREGVPQEKIILTGNTAIDALFTTVRKNYKSELLDWSADSRLVLMTAHRRENLGEPMRGMLLAIRRAIEENNDVKLIFPVHPNPSVRAVAGEILGNCERMRLVKPLGVLDFHNIMARSYMILTDSGGIQEEAPSLGKPVVVMRDTTERPEGVKAGTLMLAGTTEKGIYESITRLLNDKSLYKTMATAKNPYGDGHASKRIADALVYDLI